MGKLKLGEDEMYNIDKEIIEKYNIKPGDISPFTGLKVIDVTAAREMPLEDMKLVVDRFDKSLIEDVMDDKSKAIDIVLENRIDMIIKNMDESNIDFGFKFILTDLFHPDDWDYLSNALGNWQIGRAFSNKINSNGYPIERIENNSQGYAQYMVVNI